MTGKPRRILHVVREMARGGVETWLMHVLRHIDSRRVQMDFLVQTDEPGDYDAEIEARGSRLLRCTAPRYSPEYARRMCALFSTGRLYDAVHSHVHHFSGYVLWLARISKIPLRVAHSHSDTSRQDKRAGWVRSRYLRYSKRWIQRNATHLVAASQVAGTALYGFEWGADARRLVLHCGIDLGPFRCLPGRQAARSALGIGEHEFVIGHTGRFAPPKNHSFLLEIAAAAALRRPETRLLLIGDGPARGSIEARARELGIAAGTIFAGVRPDVPDLLAAMDVFVFPSLWEGLPLTVIEAQAAGLRCVLSDVISEEADVAPGLTTRLPIDAGAEAWAREVLHASEVIPAAVGLKAVEDSSFNIERSVEQLYALYSA
jgi:glycosyltransferase involved in cell wall biosynthesis